MASRAPLLLLLTLALMPVASAGFNWGIIPGGSPHEVLEICLPAQVASYCKDCVGFYVQGTAYHINLDGSLTPMQGQCGIYGDEGTYVRMGLP